MQSSEHYVIQPISVLYDPLGKPSNALTNGGLIVVGKNYQTYPKLARGQPKAIKE